MKPYSVAATPHRPCALKMTFTFARNIFRAHARTRDSGGIETHSSLVYYIWIDTLWQCFVQPSSEILKQFNFGAMKIGHFSILCVCGSSWIAVSIKLYLLLKLLLVWIGVSATVRRLHGMTCVRRNRWTDKIQTYLSACGKHTYFSNRFMVWVWWATHSLLLLNLGDLQWVVTVHLSDGPMCVWKKCTRSRQ